MKRRRSNNDNFSLLALFLHLERFWVRAASFSRIICRLVRQLKVQSKVSLNLKSLDNQRGDPMTKPIPDKAEIALEYPDKLYIGTFERSSNSKRISIRLASL